MLGSFWQDLRLAARIETFFSPLIDRLQTIPGISGADVSTGLPLLRVNAMGKEDPRADRVRWQPSVRRS